MVYINNYIALGTVQDIETDLWDELVKSIITSKTLISISLGKDQSNNIYIYIYIMYIVANNLKSPHINYIAEILNCNSITKINLGN